MGIYQFKEQDAIEFGRFVGIQTFRRGDELHFKTCPYCQSRKDLDTFAISLKTGTFNCKRASCGVTGNMITISRDFGFSLGNEVDEYYRPKKKFKNFPQPKEPIKPKPPAIEYLKSRGISEEVAEKYEITVQTKHENVLVFPFYDEYGKLQFIKYRKTDFDKEKDKNKEWCEANGRPILFGIKQCSGEFNRLVITEGNVDSLSVATTGIENAVSVPTGALGMTWIPYCYNFVSKFKEIVVFGDYEKGHITLLDDIKKRFQCRIKHVREMDYKGCKDANEILQKYGKEAVKHAVENAITEPIEHVIMLQNVQRINPYRVPKLKTGIKWMDNILYGGMPFGCVCVLTGREGCGKSTLGSQMIVNAVEQGYITFAYSGELTNGQFRDWFETQAAGKQHICVNYLPGGIKEQFITDKNSELLEAWYSEKMYLYDNTIIEEDERAELLKIIEKSICQYGINVVLLDNLMTAMYEDNTQGNDRNTQQGVFVRKLTRIAMKHNVLIILVAHMRKVYGGMAKSSMPENDEISGSADIANLAGIIIGFSKGTDKEIADGDIELNQRRLTIMKNRMFGRTDKKGIILNYDEVSRRLYGELDDANREYGWNNTDGFESTGDGEVVFG